MKQLIEFPLFGLKMNAEAGAVIASGGVEANYKVTLTWKREEKKA